MKEAGDLQEGQVIPGKDIQDSGVHSGLMEDVLVLRQADVIQPLGHPHRTARYSLYVVT